MEFIYSTIEEYSNSRNISSHVPHLQSLISALARQERILKMRIRNHPTGVNRQIKHINNKICKHARFKRKIAIINSRLKGNPHQCICTMHKIAKYYRDIMRPVNFQIAVESLQRYGNIDHLHVIFSLLANI